MIKKVEIPRKWRTQASFIFNRQSNSGITKNTQNKIVVKAKKMLSKPIKNQKFIQFLSIKC